MKFAHKCHLCGEVFNIVDEEVYCVNNLILSPSEADKQLHWRFVQDPDNPIVPYADMPFVDKITRIEMWFHRKCFESVAGGEYLSVEVS